MVGTVSDASVAAPVIHVIVPSQRAPARRSICGPSAAKRTGGATASMSNFPRAVTVSPTKLTDSPPNSGISTSRYSRAWRNGLSNDWPHMPSTTGWCDSPIPSVKLPPVSMLVVIACSAITIGCRG